MTELSRRDFMVLSGAATMAAACSPRALAAEQAAVFPYSTHIYREPSLPLEQLEADLPVLKRLGFSMIKIQESWSTDERRPGEVDLSHVERVIAGAQQHGLLVYFGITMEQAPAWLWKKYPDANMIYEDGTAQDDPTQYLLSSDGKPGPCWHHPQARAAAENFIETVGRRLGRYRNIAVWNVWQEIGLAPWSTRPGHRYLCYCNNSLAAFRLWLQERYTSLSKLNDSWRTAFASWEEVEPPRLFAPVPSMLDWRFFMEDQYLGEVVRWKGDAFRRSDPLHRPIMAHVPGSVYGSAANWAYSRGLDIFGTSLYPGWGEAEDLDVTSSERLKSSQRPLEQLCLGVMLSVDYSRSAAPAGNIWAAELQGGRAGGGPTPGRTPDPGDIRRWVLGAVAAGARAICFWNHRNEIMWSETSGFGLLNRTGDSTARAEEAGRIGRALQAESEFFTKSSSPPARVGILVNERQFQFAAASEPAIVKAQQLATVRGLYRGLWTAGIPVDFINIEDLPEKPTHAVLLLPLPLCLSAPLGERLAKFVQQGGTLISEATPGRFDEYGFGRPEEMGPGLAQLFGADHDQLMAWQTDESHTHQSAPVPWAMKGVGPLAGQQALGSLYLQTLKLRSGAQAILQHGDFIVGSLNRQGSGQAILIGSLLGSAMEDGAESGNAQLLVTLLAGAGVKSDKIGRLLLRRRTLGSAQAWFLINPTHEAVREEIDIGKTRTVTDLLSGRLSPKAGKISIEVGPLDIVCLMLK